MNRVGFIGWRGMVGSVLMGRMLEENDFAVIPEPIFFTTSKVGQPGPDVGKGSVPLRDAADLEAFARRSKEPSESFDSFVRGMKRRGVI